MPTSEFWQDGFKIEPDVSVPTAAAAKLAAMAAPEPELDPPTSNFPAHMDSTLDRLVSYNRFSYQSP